MTVFLLFLSVLISMAIGACLVYILWPGQREMRPSLLLNSCLAMGIGFGVTSLSLFAWLCAAGPSNKFILFELAALAGLFALFSYLAARKDRTSPGLPGLAAVQTSKINPLIIVSFYILLASSVAIFICSILRNPHGSWDAWGVWNAHARQIFRSGEDWKTVFSEVGMGNRDYPLLISLTIARIWKYIGTDTVTAPALVAMLFTFAIAGFLLSSVSLLRDKAQGYLAAVVLLGTPAFNIWAPRQYADIPLSFFILVTIALLFFYGRLETKNNGLLILAGLAAGCAAWTKNEGLIFVVVAVFGAFIATVLTKGWRAAFRQVFFFGIGLAPFLIAFFYLKLYLVPRHIFLAPGDTKDVVERLSGFTGYLPLLKAFIWKIARFGQSLIPPVPILLACLFLLGIKPAAGDRKNMILSLSILFLMLASYFTIFASLPLYDRQHLLKSDALDRLLLQLWPSFIFAYFMLARSAGKADK